VELEVKTIRPTILENIDLKTAFFAWKIYAIAFNNAARATI